MIDPHGGKLINRIYKKTNLDLDNIDLEIFLTNSQISEVKNIASGVYSPLPGYMGQDDFESVVEKMRLANGVTWSIPVFFPKHLTVVSLPHPH